MVAWAIVFFSWVHTIAHLNNVAQLSAKNGQGFKGFLRAGFLTGPTWTGWIMLIALMLMVGTSVEKPRRANFERFWYTHHLFVVFFIFWSMHGIWCMIPADFAPFCLGTGVFYEYWIYGAVIYLAERVAREIRGRHATVISKVIQHPSNVVEIQIKKEKTITKAGQVSTSVSGERPDPDVINYSTSSSAAQKYPSGNITLSLSPVLLKKITSPFISAASATSPRPSPKP